ncbi:MAG: carboxypeptidase regulatory-like domain-containing protein [Acidobacteriia bacterium]|nr:carboxypeptidase regulatory-like domain-containing protein [Terriglobia bacterium]
MSRVHWLISATLLLSLAAARPSHGAPPGKSAARAALTGTVRGASGESMEGVTVSAAAEGGTITTSVYTDDQGRFYFPTAPSGKYRVWAQAVGFQAARAEVELSATGRIRQDFTLAAAKDFERQLTSPEWLSALPAEKQEDVRLKLIFVHNCTTCHSAAFVLQNKFDEAGWKAILARMETINVYGKAGDPPNPVIQHYKEELAAYLFRVRGPGPSPLNVKPLPRPSGDAAHVVVTEFNVPSAANPNELVDQDGSDWSGGIPSGGNGSAGLHDLTIDANGNAWVTNGTENRNRSFLKLDVETGKVTNFRLPAPNGFARGTHGIAQDRNGIIWANVFEFGGTFGRGSLLRLDPKTEKYEVFTPPAEMGTVGISVEVDGKGKIWATSDGAIVFNPSIKQFTWFKPLTPGTGGYGVTGDSAGNGWFCQPGLDVVGIADFTSKKVSEIRLPARPGIEEISTEEDRKFDQAAESSFTTGILPAEGPRRMAAQGDYVWWSNWFGQSISRANIRNHEVEYFNAPFPNSSPYAMISDRNGMLWVALPNDDRVAKLDPVTRQWTLYNLPSHGTNTRFITVDDHKPSVEVWEASFMTSKVVRLQFRTKQQMQALAELNGATLARATSQSRR